MPAPHLLKREAAEKSMEEMSRKIAESVEKLGYECVHVGLKTDSPGSGLRLQVLIDSLGGINIEDCERVSRAVDRVLDEEDFSPAGTLQPGSGSYALEVSSPGVERPLFTIEQYARFAGREAHVRLSEPVEGRKSITGEIVSAGDGHLVLYAPDEEREITIPFEAVKAGNLVFRFDTGEPKKEHGKKSKGKQKRKQNHEEEL